MHSNFTISSWINRMENGFFSSWLMTKELCSFSIDQKFSKCFLIMMFLIGINVQSSFAQVSYTQNFSASGLNSWTSQNGSFSSTTTDICATTRSIRANIYNFNATGNFRSPLLSGNNGGEITFQYDYKIINWSGGAATPNTFGTLKVQYASSTSGPWTDAPSSTISTNHVPSTSCVTRTVNFTPPTGNLYVRFNVAWAAGDYYMYFDEIIVSQGAPPACTLPSSLTASGITSDGATISWTAPASAPSDGYEYEVRTSGAAGSGATGLVDSGSNSAGDVDAAISGLTANTTYSYYVRSNCGGDGFSDWSGAGTFTTLCSAETAPTSTQTFATFSGSAPNPVCWSEAKGAVANPSTLTTANSEWLDSDFANTGSNTGVKTNLWGTNPGEWIISQPIDLGATAGLYRVKYDMAVTSYNGTAVQATLGTHIVRVIISTDGGATWNLSNTIKTYTGAATYSNTSQTETINLTSYSGVVKIAFVATTSSNSPDIDFHIDNFVVEAIPSCAEPTDVAASLIAGDSATISWTAPASAPASGYEYEVRTSGAPGEPGATIASTTAAGEVTANVIGLSATTTYSIYVRSNCGGGEYSPWTAATTFTTTQIPATLPLTDSFATNNFTFINGSQTNKWAYGSAAGNPANSIYISNDNGVSNAYSNGSTSVVQAYRDITIPSGATLASLSFDWIGVGESCCDYIRVWMVPSSFVPTAGSQITSGTGRIQIGGNLNSQGTWQTFSNATLDVSSFANSTMRLVFEWRNDFSTGSNPAGGIDNVSLEIPACFSPTATTSSALTTSTATISWTAAPVAPSAGYEYEVRTSGAAGSGATGLVDSGSTIAGDVDADIIGLDAETTYSVYVRSNCDGGDFSDWTSEYTFATLPNCLIPTSLTSGLITNNSVTISWTAPASAPSDGYEYEVRSSGAAGSGATGLVDSGSNAAGDVDANITGLDSNTLYSFYVRSNCGASGFSDWSAAATFTTQLVFATPYEEGFVTTATPAGYTTTGWTIGSTRGVTGNPGNNIYRNLWGSATSGTFTTANIGPITAGQFLTIDYKHSNYSAPFAAPGGGSGSFIVNISTDYGQNYAVLQTVNNDSSNEWRTLSYDLTSYVGQNIRIRISASRTSGDYDLAFDNIKVETPPTCFVPTDVVASSITADSSTITWTAPDTAPSAGYEFEVRTSGAAGSGATGLVDSGSTIAGDVDTDITGLEAETTYTVYVRSNCDGGDFSTWTVGYTFTTLATCSFPSDLTSSSITLTTATISWTAPASAPSDGYEYEVRSSGAAGSGATGLVDSGSNAAGDVDADITGLETNTTYSFYIRSNCGMADGFSAWTAAGTFTTPVAGESCDTAALIAVAPNVGAAVNTLLTTGLTSDGPDGTCSNATGNPSKKDRWVAFVAPASGNKVIISTTAGTLSDAVMQVWSSCPATGVALGCSDDVNDFMPELEFCSLTPGETYYVQIWPWSTTATGNFNITIYEDTACPVPPANDECAGVETITVGAAGSCPTSAVTGTTVNATATPGVAKTSCDNFGTYNDVFYKFNTGSNTSVDFTFTSLTGTNEFGIYSACGSGFIPSLCSSSSPYSENISGLEQNTDYYVIVWANSAADAGEFSICIATPAPPACIPSPTAPSDSADICISVTGTTLSWPVSATATAYDVYLDTTDGTTLLVADHTTNSYETPAVLTAGVYYWRVVPKNGTVEASACSTWTFTVNALPTFPDAGASATFIDGEVITLAANDPAVGIGVWTVVSGPSTDVAQFGNATVHNTSFNQNGGMGTYVLRWTISNGACGEATSDVSITIEPVKWSGGVWNNGTGPTALVEAEIDGDYVSADDGGSIAVKNLTITPASTLTISTGDVLTVAGAIINNATVNDVVIESGAYLHQTSDDANTGSITIKRATNIKRLDISLWSSPVAAQNLLALSPQTLTNRFFSYDEAANNWTIIADVANQTMAPAAGYGVRAPNNWPTTLTTFTAEFKGVPNNGNYTQAFTSDHATANFNLVGNPYPSVLDLRAFYAANTGKIINTFYFFEHTVTPGTVGQTNYGTLTIAPDAADNNYVPASSSLNFGNEGVVEAAEAVEVGQGFFVRAVSGEAGNLDFNNAMRKTTPGVFFRNAATAINNESEVTSKFRLQMTSPEGFVNQTVVGYYDYASNGLDMMDAQGIGSPLYTILDNKKLASQGFGLPFNQGQVIPLGGNFAIDGEYTIGLHSAQGIFGSTQYVLIHDTTLGIYHNLSLSPYSFQASGGADDTRFKIVFTSILSTENPDFAGNSVVVYEINNILQAQVKGNTLLESIQVVDLSGKILFEKAGINANLYNINKIRRTETILLVTTTTKEGLKQTHKIFY